MARKYYKLLNRKLWVYVGLIVLIVGAILLAHWAQNLGNKKSSDTIAQAKNKTKIDYTPATKADNAANEARKGSSSAPSSTLENYSAPSNTATFGVTVTRAGLSSDRNSLLVAALVNGVNSGTCTFNIHKDGQPTVTESEPLSLQVNSYVCPSMDIPLNKFPVRGSWSVSVTVNSNGKNVTADWANNPVSLD